MTPLAIYLLVINVTAYIMMGDDKRRAVMNKRRIPERTLLLTAALGGSLGELLGMTTYHHKTRHKKFLFLVPTLLVVHIAALAFLLLR